MKAPLSLNSVIEKVAIVAAFLPLVFMVYPEFAAAGFTAQNKASKALVFAIDSKSTPKALLSYDELAQYHANTDIPTLLAPKVKAYLEAKGSPLAQYADEIVKQPQWQRALAISYVESNFGKRCADNNCSGIGVSPSHKSWRRYATKLDWFKDMSALLEKPIYKERYTNCASMKGVYVVPGSARWVNGCTQVSNELLALTAEAENQRVAYIGQYKSSPFRIAGSSELAELK